MNFKIKEEIIKPPTDNCLILIDVESTESIRSLISNIKDIQEQIKDFVLVLMSEDEMIFPNGANLPSLELLEIHSFSDKEMKMY